MPEGSIASGWLREVSVAGGAPTILSLGNGDSWATALACPNGEEGVYQVFYTFNPREAPSACISFATRTYKTSDVVAWEY